MSKSAAATRKRKQSNPITTEPSTKRQRTATLPKATFGHEQAPATPESNARMIETLEASMDEWPGFSNVGWWSATADKSRFLQILDALKTIKDEETGECHYKALDSIPDEQQPPKLPKDVPPISFSVISSRTSDGSYTTTEAFDLDMAHLFLRGRRSYKLGSKQYGHVLLLQRFYQALISPCPPSSPYSAESNHASLSAGPGRTKPISNSVFGSELATGVTFHTIKNRDKKHVEPEVNWRGYSFQVGDYVHLANPDDPSRPIVGQIFKIFVNDTTDVTSAERLGMTVSWYFRPEQTFHEKGRMFWEQEIFKSRHFADHPFSDVIERVAVQFTARHLRGRPAAPAWYPGWPLYVCDSRYNDAERIFVKIKNWNSCIPEELRKHDWGAIVPFAGPAAQGMPSAPVSTNVVFKITPLELRSPFLTGLADPAQSPGGLIGPDKREMDLAAIQQAEAVSPVPSKAPVLPDPPQPHEVPITRKTRQASSTLPSRRDNHVPSPRSWKAQQGASDSRELTIEALPRQISISQRSQLSPSPRATTPATIYGGTLQSTPPLSTASSVQDDMEPEHPVFEFDHSPFVSSPSSFPLGWEQTDVSSPLRDMADSPMDRSPEYGQGLEGYGGERVSSPSAPSLSSILDSEDSFIPPPSSPSEPHTAGSSLMHSPVIPHNGTQLSTLPLDTLWDSLSYGKSKARIYPEPLIADPSGSHSLMVSHREAGDVEVFDWDSLYSELVTLRDEY